MERHDTEASKKIYVVAKILLFDFSFSLCKPVREGWLFKTAATKSWFATEISVKLPHSAII